MTNTDELIDMSDDFLEHDNAEIEKKKKEWFHKAKNCTKTEDLVVMFNELQEYKHDYSTIVNAFSAFLIASFNVMINSENGGISGWQGSFIAWSVFRELQGIDCPTSLINYEDMLYPQNQENFKLHIDSNSWEWVQDAARKLIDNVEKNKAHHKVLAHWQSIVDGKIPFGYTLRESRL